MKNQNTTPEGANPPRPGGGEGTEVLPTGNYRPRVRAQEAKRGGKTKKKRGRSRPQGRSRACRVSKGGAWSATCPSRRRGVRQPTTLPQRGRWRRWRVRFPHWRLEYVAEGDGASQACSSMMPAESNRRCELGNPVQ